MSTAAPTKTQKAGTYEVPRAAGRCAVCGREIAPGETFMTAVRETPRGIERVDVSPESWPALDRAGVLAFWQSVMPHAEQKKKVCVDDEVLCDLFERLADTAEP